MKSIDDVSKDYEKLEKMELRELTGGQHTYDDSDKTYFGANGDCYVRGGNGAPSGYEVW